MPRKGAKTNGFVSRLSRQICLTIFLPKKCFLKLATSFVQYAEHFFAKICMSLMFPHLEEVGLLVIIQPMGLSRGAARGEMKTWYFIVHSGQQKHFLKAF
jgi:hypothetical protein